MARSDNLRTSKKIKNDEFYTLFENIQAIFNTCLDYNPDLFRDNDFCISTFFCK